MSILALALKSLPSSAQETESRKILENIVESLANQSGEAPDQNQMLIWYEQLAFYLEHPIPINHSDADELGELPVWNERQIHAFLRYREELGPLVSLLELQAVPGLDLVTIKRLRPFVTVAEEEATYQVPLGKLLTDGRDEVSLRWQRNLELPRGFRPQEDSLPPAFAGDPNRFYFRYRHHYSNRLSYGLVLEKDPGETFTFDGQAGFDFVSSHLYARELNSWLKHLAIGDFNISLGQGLIRHSGFGRGKNALIAQIKKSGRSIRPSASVNETDFFRGAAASIALFPETEWTLFASHRKLDGNLVTDPTDTSGVFEHFTSLQESGLHRTVSEREDRDKIKHSVVGGRARKSFTGGSVSFNIMYHHFSPGQMRREALYSKYYFNGSQLLNLSLDYSWVRENLHLFGECARSENGGMAVIQGAMITLHPKLDLAVLFRSFGRNYQSIRPNPFAETSGARNETGWYTGMILRFSPRMNLGLYADFWHHPWLRFNTDAPSSGREYLARVNFKIKRTMEAYLQYRFESKERNAGAAEEKDRYLASQLRRQVRLHFSRQLDPFELRNRIEWSVYELNQQSDRGFLVLQDILYKPLASPYSFTARIAYFDTDSFSSRLYAYENDLIYTFSIPPYFRKGIRYYFNLRYKGIRDLTLEARFARTTLLDDTSFSSGYDAIEGRYDSEIKVQVIYRW